MKVSKHDLCSSCRKIRPIMSGGKPASFIIEEFLDSPGYNMPMGEMMGNQMLLLHLQDNGGCSNCINLFR